MFHSKSTIAPLIFWFFGTMPLSAQYAWQHTSMSTTEEQPLSGSLLTVEAQGSFSHGSTPLWFNANRYGLSSLKEKNAYMRAALIRPIETDSVRRWALGYGLDVAVPANYTSHFIVQQAYAEVRWLHGQLTIGCKQWPMQLKSNSLSSGSQTLGINARPIPQVRLALPEYWTVPLGGRWLHLKGHVAFGMLTDDGWERNFTQQSSKYAEHVLYHSKAGYLLIGNGRRHFPLSLELGLEMATTFGGTTYSFVKGNKIKLKNKSNLKAFWDALIPGGQDMADGMYPNAAGNTVGSWLARINYDAPKWKLGVYADHFFEDDSQMFLLDYNGYGEGSEWKKKKHSKWYFYKPSDIMLGIELNLKQGTWLNNIVAEYIYTKNQSGPYNHDHSKNIADHISGNDNYYNNYVYPGWQHWGQVIGNPLYRSPIYNTDNLIEVEDNRFCAVHVGFEGCPAPHLYYRVLASWQEGLGTYSMPYTRHRHNTSAMAEAAYTLPRQWKLQLALGLDHGSILGNNSGVAFTISHTMNFQKLIRNNQP